MRAKILDVACGPKMFYFDKSNPDVLFCDIREENQILCDGREIKIKPNVVCDFRNLPFDDASFYLVIFDPPHLLHAGDNSWLAKKYGRLNNNWQEDIKQGFDECMRVLKTNGTLIFKWSETDITVAEIIKTIGCDPVIGHKSGKLNKTHWLCFFKKE